MATTTPKKKTRSELEAEVAHVLASSKHGSLIYRTLGSDGERWPSWLHSFKTTCGVYVIRDKSSGSALYVGSSKNRLYDTITRHFQQWKRRKNWWKGAYGAGHDPGMTYLRSRCEVAVRVVACGDQLDEESRLIAKLRPRDNLVEHPDGDEEIPF